MLRQYHLQTPRDGFFDITETVQEAVRESGVAEGICIVYCPHTTAGITINENADPDVLHDLALGLGRAYPEQAAFRHFEGNSTAHLKAGAVGASATLIVHGGRLLLGRWQGIYFCEFDGHPLRPGSQRPASDPSREEGERRGFDGPKDREYYVKIIEG